MGTVTFQVLDGADRGKTYQDLVTPVTIGREEGNSIQLNDERVSRFHLKIQEDHDKLVLTDLESTNGTKVNGEETRLHILRFGDTVSVGRSVLVYGTREQIAQRLAELRGGDAAKDRTYQANSESGSRPDLLDFELNWPSAEVEGTLRLGAPPDLPDRMSPGQAAQLAELLGYLHIRLRVLIASVAPTSGEQMLIETRTWQNLLDLQKQLALYQRKISEPPSA